jgi:hypothetical protein
MTMSAVASTVQPQPRLLGDGRGREVGFELRVLLLERRDEVLQLLIRDARHGLPVRSGLTIAARRRAAVIREV